jgi:hypothetical protein
VNLPEGVPGLNGVDDLLSLPTGREQLTALLESAMTGDPAGRVYPADDRDPVELASGVLADLAAEEADAPTLFRQGDMLVRATPLSERMLIEPLTEDRLSYRLAHLGKWASGKLSEPTKRKFKAPPRPLLKHILASPAGELPFPALHRVVTVPILTATGELLDRPGYDRRSGIFYLPTVEMRPLPATLTAEDVAEARALIVDELLGDFPFATEADRVNACGLLLLPFVREMVSNATPLHLVEASTAGSGKSLLAGVLLALVSGRGSRRCRPANTTTTGRRGSPRR